MTTTPERPPQFPATFGPDVTTRDINLDAEEFIVGGERLTEQRAAELAERVERATGRPSLTAPGRHSPTLSLRLPEAVKANLEAAARAQGRRQSDIVREALEEYLASH